MKEKLLKKWLVKPFEHSDQSKSRISPRPSRYGQFLQESTRIQIEILRFLISKIEDSTPMQAKVQQQLKSEMQIFQRWNHQQYEYCKHLKHRVQNRKVK